MKGKEKILNIKSLSQVVVAEDGGIKLVLKLREQIVIFNEQLNFHMQPIHEEKSVLSLK